ncbi:iron chaperone [Stenotrophomonas acidaminiphila]
MTRTTATKSSPRKSAAKKTAAKKSAATFTAEEQAAMKARARELKAEARANRSSAEGEADLLARVDEMAAAERDVARRIHALVMATAPGLQPRTWYGMPAWAKDGKVLCFFQSAGKFKTRYATFGFSDQARLDDGGLWPTSFAIHRFGDAEAATLAALVRRAAG